jgi:hypothetical protein
MKRSGDHDTFDLETVNALLTEPSHAIGVEGHPDVAVLVLKSSHVHWGTGLDEVVNGCLVLGFKKIIARLDEADISSSFHIACLASAWQRLIDNGGTLILSNVTGETYRHFAELIDPALFNIHATLPESVNWLDEAYEAELSERLPRVVTCSGCGGVGQVSSRGEHLCTDCGATYLVTERGEIPL